MRIDFYPLYAPFWEILLRWLSSTRARKFVEEDEKKEKRKGKERKGVYARELSLVREVCFLKLLVVVVVA